MVREREAWDPGVQRDIAERHWRGERVDSVAAVLERLGKLTRYEFVRSVIGNLRRHRALTQKQLDAINRFLARIGEAPIRLATKASKRERFAAVRAASAAALDALPKPLRPPRRSA